MPSRWDARLLTPERAISLVVDWPLVVDSGLAELSQFEPEGGGPHQADQAQVNMRCWQHRPPGRGCRAPKAGAGVHH